MRSLQPVTVWFDRSARAAMLREARARRVVETGGALFGYLSSDAVVIERIGVARGRTRRTPVTFRPDPADLQEQIDEIIAGSDGRRYFLGEWHTHPIGLPYLSRTDKRSVQATAENPAVAVDRPTAIVVAPTGVPHARMRVAAFVWDPTERVVSKRPCRSFDVAKPR